MLLKGVDNSGANSFRICLGKSLGPSDFLAYFKIILQVHVSVTDWRSSSSLFSNTLEFLFRGGNFVQILAKWLFIILICSSTGLFARFGMFIRFNFFIFVPMIFLCVYITLVNLTCGISEPFSCYDGF